MRGRAAAPQDYGGEWGLCSPTPCDTKIRWRRGGEDTSGVEGRGVASHVVRMRDGEKTSGTTGNVRFVFFDIAFV